MNNDDTNAAMALAILDSATQSTYGALRNLGLSIEATKDAITVHVSDLLSACQYERDGVPTPTDDDGGDSGGGVRTR